MSRSTVKTEIETSSKESFATAEAENMSEDLKKSMQGIEPRSAASVGKCFASYVTITARFCL